MQITKHRDKRKADKRANKDRYENGDRKKKKKRVSEREARVYNGKAGIKAQIVLW